MSTPASTALPDAAIDRAAEILLAARLENRVIDGIPDECRPRSIADAFRVQDGLVEKLGWPIAGWFAGCTNPLIQQQLGLDGPYTGRVFRRFLFEAPATIRADDFPPIVLECEFAFTLGRALPARAAPYDRAAVLAACASVHPAIEVVAGHLRDWTRADIFSIIADNGTDGALVLGPANPVTDPDALPSTTVLLTINGKPAAEGSGQDVMGDPVAALVWLVNARTSLGDTLPAGCVLSTGTTTPMRAAVAGDEAVADFGPLGRVALAIA
jgi:2-keto-4-pentenoate hydratase